MFGIKKIPTVKSNISNDNWRTFVALAAIVPGVPGTSISVDFLFTPRNYLRLRKIALQTATFDDVTGATRPASYGDIQFALTNTGNSPIVPIDGFFSSTGVQFLGSAFHFQFNPNASQVTVDLIFPPNQQWQVALTAYDNYTATEGANFNVIFEWQELV